MQPDDRTQADTLLRAGARVLVFAVASVSGCCLALLLSGPLGDLLSVKADFWSPNFGTVLVSSGLCGFTCGVSAASQVGRARQDAATRWGMTIAAGVGTLVVCVVLAVTVLPLVQ